MVGTYNNTVVMQVRMTSARRRQLRLQAGEKLRIERQGLRAVRKDLVAINADVIRTFKGGHDPRRALEQLPELLMPTFRDGMMTAHLRGAARALRTAREAIKGKRTALSTYDETLTMLEARLLLTATQTEQLRMIYTDQAMFVLSEAQRGAEAEIVRALQDIVREGLHVQAGTARLRQAMSAAGVSPRSPHLVETLFRTQTQLSYSAGRSLMNRQPGIDEELWGYTYYTAGDDRVRPNHAAMDGITLPKGDPFWRTSTPPNGYNCRCDYVEEFRPQKEIGPEPKEIDGNLVEPVPDVSRTMDWAFDPGDVYEGVLTGVRLRA